MTSRTFFFSQQGNSARVASVTTFTRSASFNVAAFAVLVIVELIGPNFACLLGTIASGATEKLFVRTSSTIAMARWTKCGELARAKVLGILTYDDKVMSPFCAKYYIALLFASISLVNMAAKDGTRFWLHDPGILTLVVPGIRPASYFCSPIIQLK